MNLIELVKTFEGKSVAERRYKVMEWLEVFKVPYKVQEYGSGANVLVHFPGKKRLAISCHFDIVKNSPGANDNASGIAVALELIKKIQKEPPLNFGISFYFFDEEENGLRGSKAFITKYGIQDLLGLINMDMVGMGDQIALWSLDNNSGGRILSIFEKHAQIKGIECTRYDKLVSHTADHMPFRKAGLEDAFTITCISEKDKEVAYHYYKAQEFDVDKEVLIEILSEAPIFKNYHKSTDTSEFLNEESLKMVEDLINKTIITLDASF